ncbi:MAG TPA: prepilin-type N-terminal cleavage/methylation domain-containing protein [Candidatus Angelobacter sp.]|nr:prepilin-type N-terminal cleavage/methylation domain-containing protein [Candidatus Angelobacter sp.]
MKMVRKTKRVGKSGGFSLIEMMIAVLVLTVGILGTMIMVVAGLQRNTANRVDTTATNAAQAVMEEIAGATANANPTLTITDCLGNNLSINTAVGGPVSTSTGDIDFTQAIVNGYQMNYTICGTNGVQTVYDVRWSITAVGTQGFGKLVTVSARQPFVAGSNGLLGIRPITLRTVIGLQI